MARTTINDVARHANVSKKTVSRVLNQEPNVHIDTRQRVLDAMNELNYRPSKQARGLASTQSFLIALVYDNPNKSYIADIQQGCLDSCNELGYHLLIQPLNYASDDSRAHIRDLVVESEVDGLILTPPFSDNQQVLTLLDELQRPFVRIGGTFKDERAAYVTANDRKISHQLIDYLIYLGHKRIGFIKGHPDHPASDLRFNGYLQALEEHGITVAEELIHEGMFSFSEAEAATRKMLALDEPPSAIFASNDDMAAAVLKVASQNNIQVPHELSVCGFDDNPISNQIWPSITTIRQPMVTIAREASRRLIRQVKTKQPEEDVIFDCDLMIRASTAPPGKK
jgi:LacI family transcriptional regulator